MIRNPISFPSLLTITTIVVFAIGCNMETKMVVKAGAGASEDSPNLIIGITIDQMRADYLNRYSPHFSEGGFARLQKDGFTCYDHHFSYAPTYTGPGHASIFTGTTPAIHGIVANDWYLRKNQGSVYCASDYSVFGVGIDYAIHLQRGYEEAKKHTSSAAYAWIKSFSIIRVALTLAVVTTVSAFLASSLSPLPPLQTFGITLALGVVCAFIASTVTVGALHVVVEKTTGINKRKSLDISEFARIATNIQQRNTARILLVVVILTTSSVFLAGTRLDTSFELTDFLSEDDMPIMEVRSDIYDSYDAAAWKSVTILIEPSDGENALNGERDMLIEFLSKKEGSKNDLNYTLDAIKKYDVIKQCYKKADHFISLASSSLNIFESSEQKNILKNLTSFSIERSF